MLATSALGSPGVCVYKWDNGNLQATSQLQHFGDAGSTAVVINCNNQVIASACESGEVKLCLPDETGRGSLFEFTPVRDREVRSLSFDPSSRYLGCGGDFEHVMIWDLKKKKKVRELKGHLLTESISSVCFSKDGQNIASGGSSGTILIHSVRERNISSRLQQVKKNTINTTSPTSSSSSMTQMASSLGQLTFNPIRPNILGAAYTKGEVVIYDTQTNSSICEYNFHDHINNKTSDFGGGVHSGRYGAISFSPINQKFLVSGGEDGKLIFADYEFPNKIVKELNPGLGSITVTQFMGDGIYVSGGTSKGVLFVYDLRNTSQPVQMFRDHASLPINSMHFHEISPDTLLTAPGSGSKQSPTDSTSSRLSMNSIDQSDRLSLGSERFSLSSIRSSFNQDVDRASLSSLQQPIQQQQTHQSPAAAPPSSSLLQQSSSFVSPQSSSFVSPQSSSNRRQINSPPHPSQQRSQHLQQNVTVVSPRPNTPPMKPSPQPAAPSPQTRQTLSTSSSFSSSYVAASASDVMLGIADPAVPSSSSPPTKATTVANTTTSTTSPYPPPPPPPAPAEPPSNSSLPMSNQPSPSPSNQFVSSQTYGPTPTLTNKNKNNMTTTTSSTMMANNVSTPSQVISNTTTPLPVSSSTPISTLSNSSYHIEDDIHHHHHHNKNNHMNSQTQYSQQSQRQNTHSMDRPETIRPSKVTADMTPQHTNLPPTNPSQSSSTNQQSAKVATSLISDFHDQSHVGTDEIPVQSQSALYQEIAPNRFERKMVEECLSEAMDDVRRDVRRDVQALHLDMLNQFEDQQQAIELMLDRFTERMASLMHENQALRRENEDLKRLY
mmetsp:Transcript_697/g.886  ORF Transcript_697/g.886 Transcript_697/m.886 type:complete len:834 (+) Transcript_697:28-2529(+)